MASNRMMRCVNKAFPKFVSVAKPAENTGIAGHSVDLVSAATAFHWFDAARARDEWRRILRARGAALLIWNRRRDDSPMMREYEALMRAHAPEYQPPDMRERDAEANMQILFSGAPPRSLRRAHSQSFDFEGLAGRTLSSSYAPLPGHDRHSQLIDGLRELFARHQRDGRVEFEYDAFAYFGSLANR